MDGHALIIIKVVTKVACLREGMELILLILLYHQEAEHEWT